MELGPLSSVDSLARLYGAFPRHEDGFGRPKKVSPEVLLLTLRALGAPLDRLEGASQALRKAFQEKWNRFVEPVAVLWEGLPASLALRSPEKEGEGWVEGLLSFENGEEHRFQFSLKSLPLVEREGVEGGFYCAKRLALAVPIPRGYHRLSLEGKGRRWETLLISAPHEAYVPSEMKKEWGVFLPLYALHSKRSWGSGDFSDLKSLLDWTASLGGRGVLTLPFLPGFLEEPFDPSPYAPVSRLFWNEFFLDPLRMPEWISCKEALVFLQSSEFQEATAGFKASSWVDYRGLMAVKKKILKALARHFFSMSSGRRGEFEAFVDSHPELRDYARFRAVMERRKIPWADWPPALKGGKIPPGEYEEEAYQYHLFVQWCAFDQVEALTGGPAGLFLDFPLGVHPFGYDTWRNQNIYSQGFSTGAPPDGFFTRGQNWGFPPLHPEKSREEGYGYLRAALRHHMEPSRILRIDHVMGLHRLFWIPAGAPAAEGCYVRYPEEELYAILCLESHRSKTLLVGEDLGTVPPELRSALKKHRIFQTYVAQFSFTGDPKAPLVSAFPHCTASVNTHDTATFAGFWKGLDILDRKERGLLTFEAAEKEMAARVRSQEALLRYLDQEEREASPEAIGGVLKKILEFLSSSQAPMILVNLEDLWGEVFPQNSPGTGFERPNWIRKTKFSFEEFSQDPKIFKILKAVNRLRKAEGKKYL